MALVVPFYVRRPSHPLGNLSLLASQLRTPRRTASALTDNFDDNSRDTAKWTTGQYKSPTAVTTGVTVNETNARVEVTPATSSSALAYSGYLSLAAYDLTNDSIYSKITSSAALPSTVEAYIGAGQDINNLYLAIISNGSVLLQKIIAGSASNDASFAYNSSTHAWLRLRHDGTTVYIDTAPSSASDPPISSDWTNQVSAARNAAIVLSNSILALGAGTYLSTATPPTVYFDGFNTGTTTSSSSTGTSASTEDADTTAASGTVAASAAGASSEGADTAVGAGTMPVSASGSSMEGTDTTSGAGAVSVGGSGAATESSDAGVGVGAASVSASGASTEGGDTVSGSGTAAVTAAGAVTEETDNGSGSGTVVQAGAGASVEGADTPSGSGLTLVSGSGSEVEGLDTCAGAGTALSISFGHVKLWMGTGFFAKPVKHWDGTAWTEKPLKYWTGTIWRAT